MKEYMRQLPPIHELQKHQRFHDLVKQYHVKPEYITEGLQHNINQIREILLSGTWQGAEPSSEQFINDIFEAVEQKIAALGGYYLKNVINATGTVLHTNLGRARLSKEVIEHVVAIAENYSNLEYDLDKGTRGSRHDILESLLTKLTGAESAMVVNNNAAAVYLILRAFAKGREVIVSRGQLVEIGGSFRISKIMEESDASLVEVGTTNKTHLFDYEEAITDQTAMIMKVHTSNFKTLGFTQTVPTEDLVALKNKHDHLLFYEDLGSGVLYDFKSHHIGDEPVVSEVIKQGVDLVSFSGDKLLGGPQAGLIVGKKELIAKLKKHQLARVLRVDKMTLAALEATLLQYIKGNEQITSLPTLRDILESEEAILKRASLFSSRLREKATSYTTTISRDFSQVGGGTMPEVNLPTYTIAISHMNRSSAELSTSLRNNQPIVITRVKNDQVILDFRTITEEEIDQVVEAFCKIENEEHR